MGKGQDWVAGRDLWVLGRDLAAGNEMSTGGVKSKLLGTVLTPLGESSFGW